MQPIDVSISSKVDSSLWVKHIAQYLSSENISLTEVKAFASIRSYSSLTLVFQSSSVTWSDFFPILCDSSMLSKTLGISVTALFSYLSSSFWLLSRGATEEQLISSTHGIASAPNWSSCPWEQLLWLRFGTDSSCSSREVKKEPNLFFQFLKQFHQIELNF